MLSHMLCRLHSHATHPRFVYHIAKGISSSSEHCTCTMLSFSSAGDTHSCSSLSLHMHPQSLCASCDVCVLAVVVFAVSLLCVHMQHPHSTSASDAAIHSLVLHPLFSLTAALLLQTLPSHTPIHAQLHSTPSLHSLFVCATKHRRRK